MKLILLETVDKLGEKGEEIEAKDGYGRNYLIPKGLAVSASDPKGKNLASQLAKQKDERGEKLKLVRLEAEKLNGTEIVLEEKASKNKLFAAVSAEKIAKKLGIATEAVKLGEPIKELGEYNITIDFGTNIIAQVVVKVQSANRN